MCIRIQTDPDSRSSAGCWNRVSSAKAEFDGSGSYGSGPLPLGETKFFIRIVMSGARSASKPVRFTSSRGTSSVDFEAERLFLSKAHPGGKQVDLPGGRSSYALYTTGAHPADQPVEWLPNGYRSFENTTKFASIAHEFVWRDVSSAYPGRWFFFVKSLKLTRQESGAYFFLSDTDLPKNWFGSGYREA